MAEVTDVFMAEVTRLDDGATIAMRGELDVYTAPAFREITVRVMQDGPRDVVIDASALSFIDAAGIGILVGLLRRTQSHGGSVRLTGASRQVAHALTVAGVATELGLVA